MLPNCEIFEIFNSVDLQESHCLTLLRGAHTERQRQHQRLIQVYGDAWEGGGGSQFSSVTVHSNGPWHCRWHSMWVEFFLIISTKQNSDYLISIHMPKIWTYISEFSICTVVINLQIEHQFLVEVIQYRTNHRREIKYDEYCEQNHKILYPRNRICGFLGAHFFWNHPEKDGEI